MFCPVMCDHEGKMLGEGHDTSVFNRILRDDSRGEGTVCVYSSHWLFSQTVFSDLQTELVKSYVT